MAKFYCPKLYKSMDSVFNFCHRSREIWYRRISKKTFKIDELVDATVDDRVLEAIVPRLNEKISKTFDKLFSAKTAAQTAEITSNLESSMDRIACNVFEKLITPYNEKIDELTEENAVLKTRLDSWKCRPSRGPNCWCFTEGLNRQCRRSPRATVLMSSTLELQRTATVARRKQSETCVRSLLALC